MAKGLKSAVLDMYVQEASNYPRKAVFSLEAPSPAICLLVQLEKHVTEEGGITPSIYTRKEPVSVSYSCLYNKQEISEQYLSRFLWLLLLTVM